MKISSQQLLSKSKGQVLIEYILLLSMVAMIGLLAGKEIASRDSQNPGFLIKKWQDLRQFIAADDPEK